MYEAELLASDKSDGTKLTYQSQLRSVEKYLGDLKLFDCTPGLLDAHFREVAAKRPGAARMARQVLAQAFMLAVLNGAQDSNPITETRGVKSDNPNFTALGKKDLQNIRQLLFAWDTGKDGHGKVRNGSMRDITYLYTATGARTSELIALSNPDFNLEPATHAGDDRAPATVLIWKTVSRNLDNKYVITECLKTDGGKRSKIHRIRA